MSQRDSGYERKEHDLYPTPSWVTAALLPFLPGRIHSVWEPAAGDGHMVDALERGGLQVIGTDVRTGADFFDSSALVGLCDSIITNPPYTLATAFIEQALRWTEASGGCVAMLLRTDFDHAKSRQHLFRDCPAFARKIVLLKRIVWFEAEPGKKAAAPSFNHAWYVWDWQHDGPPQISWTG